MADWDIAIIGAGAAGLTAATEVTSAGLSCVLIDRMGGGGELMNLGALHDLPNGQTGPGLAADLLEAAITAGVDLSIGEVTALVSDATGWQVIVDDDTHHARAVILATGLGPGTLGLDAEQDYDGRGLSHCAACDGPLYHGQPVVVAGADRWALAEAIELAPVASVTLVTQGAPAPLIPELTIIEGRITALNGTDGLESITVTTDDGDTRTIPAAAVFVQCARRPALGFAPAGLARDADGRVITDAMLQTSLPRLLAVGDVRAGSQRTLAAAADDGRLAATSAQTVLAPLGKSPA